MFSGEGGQCGIDGRSGSRDRRETEAGTLAGLFIEHFPGGPTDPGYVLLKFTANHATYWIEGTFIHKKLD